MAEPSWQELLRLRLAERNNADSAFAPIIEQCELIVASLLYFSSHFQDRRLAQQTKLLKERNATLLRAVGTVKGSGNTSGTSVSEE